MFEKNNIAEKVQSLSPLNTECSSMVITVSNSLLKEPLKLVNFHCQLLKMNLIKFSTHFHMSCIIFLMYNISNAVMDI